MRHDSPDHRLRFAILRSKSGMQSRHFSVVTQALASNIDGPDRLDIARSAARPERGLRLLFTISLKGGIAGGGAITVVGACSWPDVTVIGASSEARNCLPISVTCQPASSRTTSESLKISSLGARAAKRFVRLVQSDPLDIRMPTQRVRSASEARPSGWPAKTFKTVI